jgi:hypothetical protein
MKLSLLNTKAFNRPFISGVMWLLCVGTFPTSWLRACVDELRADA